MLALIPARSGSKRLPGKNIAAFCGKPLIAWTIAAALGAKRITDVVVSTDSSEIADIARRYGARAPFLRPKRLAGVKTSSEVAFKHAIDKLRRDESKAIDAVCILQPTSPLRTAEDIDKAVNIFVRKKADSVVSFTRASHSLNSACYIRKGGKVKHVFSPSSQFQGKEEIYHPNGAIYVVRGALLERLELYSKNSYAYVMLPERSIDIDTEEELMCAEGMYRRSTEKRK